MWVSITCFKNSVPYLYCQNVYPSHPILPPLLSFGLRCMDNRMYIAHCQSLFWGLLPYLVLWSLFSSRLLRMHYGMDRYPLNSCMLIIFSALHTWKSFLLCLKSMAHTIFLEYIKDVTLFWGDAKQPSKSDTRCSFPCKSGILFF